MGRTCRANASYHFAVLTNICMCTCVRVCTGAYTRSRAKRRLDQVICPAYHTTHASLLFLTETYRCLGGGGPLPETSSRTQRSQRPRSDGVCFFQGIIPSSQQATVLYSRYYGGRTCLGHILYDISYLCSAAPWLSVAPWMPRTRPRARSPLASFDHFEMGSI
jgi:hypothetical protein